MKSKLWLMHSGKPVNITVLSEQSAIELGANLLGETIIFVVAAAILTAEYARQSRKETAKETLRKYEMELCQGRLNELYFEIERQTTQIRELTRLFYDLGLFIFGLILLLLKKFFSNLRVFQFQRRVLNRD